MKLSQLHTYLLCYLKRKGINYSLTSHLLPLTSILLLTGCVFDDHSQDAPVADTQLGVFFDWQGVDGTARPSTMALTVFADGAQPVQTAFHGHAGGRVALAPNTYAMVGFNDDTEGLQALGSTYDSYEIAALPTVLSRVSAMFANTPYVPRAQSTSANELVAEPDMLWATASPKVVLSQAAQSWTMPMETATTEYRFTFTDVENLNYAVETVATISGMSGSWIPALHACSDTHCIIPFRLSGEGSTLTGSVRTFGHCPDSEDGETHDHWLVIYAEMKDGSKVYFSTDVTEAMHDADHVTDGTGTGDTELPIVVDGLPLPKPITNGSGLQPSVSEWKEISIDIPM